MSRFKHTHPTQGCMEAAIGKKISQLHAAWSVKAGRLEKSCGGAAGRFCTGSDVPGAQWPPVTTDPPHNLIWCEGTGISQVWGRRRMSQSFDKVIGSGRKADVDTDYSSLMHLLGLLMYRMELKTQDGRILPWCPEASFGNRIMWRDCQRTTLHARLCCELEEGSRVGCSHRSQRLLWFKAKADGCVQKIIKYSPLPYLKGIGLEVFVNQTFPQGSGPPSKQKCLALLLGRGIMDAI